MERSMQIVMLHIPAFSQGRPWIQVTELGLIEKQLEQLQVGMPEVIIMDEVYVNEQLRSCRFGQVASHGMEVGEMILFRLLNDKYELVSGTVAGPSVDIPAFCTYCLVKK